MTDPAVRAAPTGEQYEIRFADQRAVVVEVGGGLRVYEAGGRPVLDGYAVDDEVVGARGQLLIPWPNRLEDGQYEWDGERQQLPLSEPESHNAIHGLVRWTSWSLVEQHRERVTLGHRVYPRAGFPFWLELRVSYRLAADGLTVRTTATNIGPRACPYGAGYHPYLTVGTDRVDDALLQVPAEKFLQVDKRGLPKRWRSVRRSKCDFRRQRRIGRSKLDIAYGELQRERDGRCRLRLADPKGRSVALWLDGAYGYLQVFTADTLPEPYRRRGLGVEPMTMPPNGLRSGDDVVRLRPGESHVGEWGIEPRPGYGIGTPGTV
jgi:aldose 1-epimerase